MATSQAAATLTRTEQRAEQKLGVLYAALAVKLFQAYVKPTDVDGAGWERFLELIVPQILKARNQAAGNGRTYYQTFRLLETGDRAFTPSAGLVSLDKSIIETSLRVTGPVAFKKRLEVIKKIDLKPEVERALIADAYKKSANGVGGAMMRHVIDGARQQVHAEHVADKVALGYMRVLKSTQPCYYCQMLASRGPVYKQDSFDHSDPRFTGDGNAKVHDNCACGLEPVFSRATPWPEGSREAAVIWGRLAKMYGGAELVRQFRAAVEGR